MHESVRTMYVGFRQIHYLGLECFLTRSLPLALPASLPLSVIHTHSEQ